jgi:hypothetical protein
LTIVLMLSLSGNAPGAVEQTIYVAVRELPFDARVALDDAPADAALPGDWRQTDPHKGIARATY